MIRLRRGSKPQVLVANERPWTDAFRRLRAGRDNIPRAAATRYRHPDIKAAVISDAHGKCGESRPLHVAPGDVEHLLPKSRFPDLIVEWDNLAFVCPDCNREKGDYYDQSEPVINPFVEDPAAHLRFAGPLVLELPADARGIVTIRKLKLDRAELVERRADHIRHLQDAVNSWAALPDGPARDEVAAGIRALAHDSGEYAAVTRSFLALIDF